MVGVLVIGVVSGVIAITVFMIVPWAQDEAAKGNIAAALTAESTVRAQHGGYQTHLELAEIERLEENPNLRVLVDDARSCFVAIGKSDTESVFFATNKSPRIQRVEETTTQDCVPADEFQDAIEAIGGEVAPPVTQPTPDPVPAPVIATKSLPSGTVGASYSGTIDFSGREASVAVTSGSLPSGLELDGKSGSISGVPTKPGSTSFTVTATGTGLSVTQDFTVTVISGEIEFVMVSSGNYHNLALDDTGHLWSWGYNEQGQLGDGTTATRTSPTRVTPDVTYTQISASANSSMAIDSAGRLMTWGSNSWGHLGTGTQNGEYLVPNHVAKSTSFKEIESSTYNSLAIDTAGHLWMWGDDYALDYADSTTVVNTPKMILPAVTFGEVSVGVTHSMALTTAGQLYTWGGNTWGQLGDGSTTRRATPTLITPTVTYRTIESGYRHSMALTTGGKLFTWGQGNLGALGNGGTANALTPTAITPSVSYKAMSALSGTSTAITTDGKLFGWGDNSSGQFGNGSKAAQLSPTQIYPGLNVTAVSVGSSGSSTWTVVVDADGHIWSSGYNGIGTLGDGTMIAKTDAIRVTVK
jgi:alpha-tubulin suppressor-like RCC1 family protein